MIEGDFNATLNVTDKRGGAHTFGLVQTKFQNFVQNNLNPGKSLPRGATSHGQIGGKVFQILLENLIGFSWQVNGSLYRCFLKVEL